MLLDATPSFQIWEGLVGIVKFEAVFTSFLWVVTVLCFVLGAVYSAFWYIVAVLALSVVVVMGIFRPVDTVLTYKCSGCGSIFSYREAVKVE